MLTPPNPPAATILYVEGDQASRTSLAQLLRDQGFRVLEAGTGREALRLAEERPDLILLDVHPPDADSFDLCERFKATPATASAPVLLFSGLHVKSEDRVRGLEGGADGYLTRPVESAEVLAHIKALLRVRRAEESLARLAGIVESSEDAVIGKSLDGVITSWNVGAERLYGYTAREALGQPISILAPPGRPDEMAGILERLRRGERVEPFETVRVRKDGSRVDVSLSVSAVRDAAGRVVGAAKIARDVTARKRVEAARARDAMLLANVRDSVFVTDLEGVVTYWNEGATRLFGWTAGEMVGRPLTDRVPEAARGEMAAVIRAVREGRHFTGEWHDYRKDGSRVWIDARVGLLRDAAGEPVGLLGLAHDVSDRKRAEEEAQRLARHIRLLMDSTGEGVYGIDTEGRCTFINRAAAEMLGFASEEVLGRNMHALIHHSRKDGSPYPPEECPILRAFRDGTPAHQDDEIIWRQDGTCFPVEYSSYPILEEGIRGAVVTFNDVTERSRAEEARRRLQAERDDILGRLQTQIERLPLARITFDADLRVTDWNPAAERVFGYSKEEVLGRGLDWFVPPEVLAGEAGERLRRLRAGDMAAHGINANWTKDGRTIFCQWFNTPLMDADGRFTGLLSLAQDVTDRIAAEEALRLRDRAIQAVTQGILITDPRLPDNPIIYASPGFERLTGYAAAEVVGRNCRFLQGPETDPATVAEVREAIREGRSCSVEILNVRKDGTRFWNALSIYPVLDGEGRVTHFVGVQADVSERRLLEAQYRQSQKMEAFGQLAGGVAHDFNNLLTVITGYSQLLLQGMSPGNPMRELLEEVCKAGERSASLTRQLLAFSRQSILAPRVLDPNAVVLDLEKILRRLIGEDIDLATDLRPALGRVKADPGLIEQVVLNLAVNARDAMPQGGKLTIETRDVELDQEYARLHTNVRPGPYVLLAVSDSGHGMTPKVQARIFEPFFTTKGPGKGTGLGLATVFGIVQQAGGHIAVYSEPGLGTTFKVYLPRVEEAVSPVKSRGGVPAAAKGTETILLVEDEDAVRSLARIVLQGAGYCVLEASDGGAARAVAGRHEGPIHLLLSDVVMPVLGGRQLAERLLALHPEMKVLFQSGYTDDAVVRHGVLQEKVHFLQKPYSPADLAMKVREVLDAPRSADAPRTIPI